MHPALDPLQLSLIASGLATLLILIPGLTLAWIQARHRYRWKAFIDALIFLPLILPPSVVGYLLVLLWGREGLLGQWLYRLFDLQLSFSLMGVVVAEATVAFPLLVKIAQVAIESVPREVEDAARVDGANGWQIGRYIILPMAASGLVGAISLAFARAMGEFGATLMFAGNVVGQTNVLPLEIYTAFQGGDDGRALTACALLALTSLAIISLARQYLGVSIQKH